MTTPLAPGCRLEPSPDLRTLDGYRILIGGAPLRILRLSGHGAALVRRWFAGEPVADRPAHHRLARRLEAGGLAHVRWPASADATIPTGPVDPSATVNPSATVVIPVRDDAAGLARTLAGLERSGSEGPALPVTVVDDGSANPIGGRGIGRARAHFGPGVEVIRRSRPGGPGVARQAGLDRIGTGIVVLVDAGVVVTPDTVGRLLAAFDDPAVVAAAPRVRSEERPGLVGRYDRRRSPLDLGPVESLVGPGRAVPYVPTACLAVRAAAVAEVGGFDPDLRFGEDVDLVWRLGRVGLVRYLPALEVLHRPRSGLVAMVRQRRGYGSAAAPLARRHGWEPLSPCRVSPWSVLVAGLGLAGRPVAATITAVGTGLALRPKIEPMPSAGAEAMSLTLRGHGYGVRTLVTAALRSWAPLMVPALLLGGRSRRLAVRVLAAAVLRRTLDGPRQPVDLVVDLSVGAVDDLAYCAGLWEGMVAERSAAAIRPALSSWPGGGGSWRDRVGATADRILTLGRSAIRR